MYVVAFVSQTLYKDIDMSGTIGLITAGGDCAGINAVLATIVKVGVTRGYSFIGFERGWEGTLNPAHSRPLDLDAVRGISHLGGTILKTTNHGRFAAKIGRGQVHEIDPAILSESKANIDRLGVQGLIVIGGDGSLSGALQMAKIGVNIIGIPKTIDNDLATTDRTFGFSTAVSIAVDALDKIHTTATSHGRVFLVECMGRNAAWLALSAGLAGGADAILIPEFPLDIAHFVSFLTSHVGTHGSAVVAVAEGITAHLKDQHDEAGAENQLMGASYRLMQAIEAKYPGQFELRNVILGHTQRGGGPNAEDRILAKLYGIEAMRAFEEGRFGHVVGLRDGKITSTPLTAEVNTVRRVTRDEPLYKTAQSMGVYVN